MSIERPGVEVLQSFETTSVTVQTPSLKACIIGPADDAWDKSPDRTPDEIDLRLRADSRAIDAAPLLPTINDHFTGPAPDLGAYEHDHSLPHYGPRPE